MEDVHPSSSHEHQSAEAVILRHVAAELGVDDLLPTRLELDGVAVELDGWSLSAPAAVEVYARVALPKGGAVKKPMDDAMRLLLVQRHHPDVKLVLAFATGVPVAQTAIQDSRDREEVHVAPGWGLTL
jgi:hypothetical protein